METGRKRAYTLISVIICFFCQLPGNAQKTMDLPFDYSNWKSREDWLSRPDLLRALPILSIAPEIICIGTLHEQENEQFALTYVRDITNGLYFGYLILYKNKSTFIYDFDAPFATYEFDYGEPVSIINALYHDMKENSISRRAIVSSIGQFVEHRLFLNKYGPGDGYYESPEYSSLVLGDTPLLDKFRQEYPFIIGFTVPEIINMLGEFAGDNGYSIESRQDVKEMLVTLYRLLSPNGVISK